MKRIVAPTGSASDWKRLLAKPYHWKPGFSAMSLAQSWESAHPGLPPEVSDALTSAGDPVLIDPRLVLAVPEYQVDIPGGSRPSQTDVLALVRTSGGLIAVAVEGKVDEAFGPTVGERRSDPSPGVAKRIAWLEDRLGLGRTPDPICYQLLHRTASALLIAEEFDCAAGVMLVHSFSPTDRWFDDFAEFAGLLGVDAGIGGVSRADVPGDTQLFLGWCKGDQRYRQDPTPGATAINRGGEAI